MEMDAPNASLHNGKAKRLIVLRLAHGKADFEAIPCKIA
jgi:hypothetical protein